MPKYSTLIVGAHFRPPAKQVLKHIVAGTELSLAEDNENAYDAAAVRVIFDPKNIPDSEFSELEVELLEAGVTLEQLMSGGPIHLGFVPAQDGKPLAKARQTNPTLLGNLQVRELMLAGDRLYPTLSFAPDGSPMLSLDFITDTQTNGG